MINLQITVKHEHFTYCKPVTIFYLKFNFAFNEFGKDSRQVVVEEQVYEGAN